MRDDARMGYAFLLMMAVGVGCYALMGVLKLVEWIDRWSRRRRIR